MVNNVCPNLSFWARGVHALNCYSPPGRFCSWIGTGMGPPCPADLLIGPWLAYGKSWYTCAAVAGNIHSRVRNWCSVPSRGFLVELVEQEIIRRKACIVSISCLESYRQERYKLLGET
ncbi:hypothetical protein PRIO_0531 [Paenibacillus riograndensis SBR5]|uniref:Uncharacterized protein n=1 Tax=Paenibacillus riograndensis SBR5 TaxID=1073571 RepID=A0A0E4H6R0_9BACL|nr:hypothetical protein PRIO_0531 [Paenibacillus riograndensis SBR5]